MIRKFFPLLGVIYLHIICFSVLIIYIFTKHFSTFSLKAQTLKFFSYNFLPLFIRWLSVTLSGQFSSELLPINDNLIQIPWGIPVSLNGWNVVSTTVQVVSSNHLNYLIFPGVNLLMLAKGGFLLHQIKFKVHLL